MKQNIQSKHGLANWFSPVITAGFVGGLMEIVWVSFYCSQTSVNGVHVAQQVTATAIPSVAGAGFASLLGVGIHLLLAMALAVAFAAIILKPVAQRYGSKGIFLSCLITLIIVWAINFFIVLPVINPAFTLLMPYIVTLISKLLFGAAMALVLIKSLPLGTHYQ